jgi:cytoskeletal protein CcmA (bactofilin family)
MGIIVAMLLALSMLLGADEPTQIIPPGQHITGSIATVVRDIQVDGEVSGDVTSWTGDITVIGHVRGDVVSYTGQVRLLSGARVDGSAMSLSGQLAIDPGARAGRPIEGGAGGRALSRLVGLFAPQPSAPAGAESAGRWLFSVLLGVTLLALCSLIVSTWPQRSTATAITLMRHPGRALAAGLLMGVALAALLPLLAGILAATLVGLPISIALLLLINLPFVIGMAALVQAARVTVAPGRNILNKATLLVAVGLTLPIALIGLVSPAAALGLFYLVASPGLGALMLSRGGTLLPARA